KGVVDLVTKKAFIYQTDGSGKFSEGEIPAGMAGAVDEAREALVEMVAEVDEKLMEKFFEAGSLTDDELVAGLRSATSAAKTFPRSPSPLRCSRTPSSRRVAETRTRSARRCTGSKKRTHRSATVAISRPKSCCYRDRDSCTSR